MESLYEILGLAPKMVNVLDVGAATLDKEKYKPLVDKKLCDIIAIEPQQEHAPNLGNTGENSAIFLADGKTHTFYSTRFPGCSSIFEPDAEIIDLFTGIGAGVPGGNFYTESTSEVDTHRLDDIVESRVDYIKIDVQGAELIVLENGIETLENVMVVETEVEFVPLYKGQPLFDDIVRFMREQGFAFHKFLDIHGRGFRPFQGPNGRCSMVSQGLWADAIFVRDFRCLEQFSVDQLLRMSCVLHSVYRSYDLCDFILGVIDAKSGCSEQSKYRTWLARNQAPVWRFNIVEN